MSAWVLVPKMLTQAMAQAIRDAADNRRFESWPANCWEGAIAVAPKPGMVQVPRELADRLTSSDNHVRQTARRELRNMLLAGEQ